MNKLMRAVSTVTLGVAMSVGVAAADSASATCNIYNTGTDSYNSCKIDSTKLAQVTCVNNIYVLNNNSQNAGTGGAIVTDNGDGGNAVTGTAINDNNVSVTIGASCEKATTVSTPPATPPTPPAGGKGGGTPAPTPQVTAKQTGGVHAGGGAGVNAFSPLLVGGLVTSVGVTALGLTLAVRKQLLNR